jgi:threonine synthase
LGALRDAVRRGRLGGGDTVVLLVTGDGLKTPQPVADLVQPIAIEADADAVLERLGVAV